MKNVGCRPIVTLLFVIAFGLLTAPAWAGGGPENVVVVVNSDSWASQAVANEFVRLRHIPPNNVIYVTLGEVSDYSTVDVTTFREKVLKPALATIRDRGLTAQIDYLVYSTDIPNAVDATADIAGRKLHQVITQPSSTTGLTFLYQQVLAKNIEYLQLGANHYARIPLQVDTLGLANDRLMMAAQGLMEEKKYERAEVLLAELLKKRPRNRDLLYNHACALSQLGKAEAALAELARAVDCGYYDSAHTAADADFKPIADREAFKAILLRMKEASTKPAAKRTNDDVQTQPTVGFRNSQIWDNRNSLAPPESQGASYLLSTFLAWTSGRGTSVGEAIECLRRSAQADGTCPKGTIYYMLNTDIRSLTRKRGFAPPEDAKDYFASAVSRLKEIGVDAEIFQVKNVNDLPAGKTDIAGLMAGSADFSFPSSSKIIPGAICEHLTSFGGNLNEDCGQTGIGEWIRAGAAGTSGTVTEPFALQMKFPLSFMHVHYAKGCSLAEAFYQSVTGPYQLMILGDPLCRPWAKFPKVQVGGVKDGEIIKGAVAITPSVKEPRGLKIGQWELFVDGKRVSTTAAGEKFTLETGDLADGYHEVRVVCVTGDLIQTQGEAVFSVTVSNAGRIGLAKSLDGGRIHYGRVAKVQAKASGAKGIVLMHNGRSIGIVQSSEGVFQVDTRVLGTGPVTLYAIGMLDDSALRSATQSTSKPAAASCVYCPPVELLVEPPLSLDPAKSSWEKMSKGGVLIGVGDKPATIAGRISGDWLTKAGVKPGKQLHLVGYVNTAEDAMHQFQVYSGGPYEITVDDRKLQPVSQEKGWQFLPVNLRAGPHHVLVSFTAAENMRMDIRFGGKGTQTLQEKNFQHLPE